MEPRQFDAHFRAQSGIEVGERLVEEEHRGFTQDTEDLIAEDPTWKFFIDAVPAGGPEPLLSDYIGMQDIINSAIQGVVLGEVTAEEAAENAQEELEGLSES